MRGSHARGDRRATRSVARDGAQVSRTGGRLLRSTSGTDGREGIGMRTPGFTRRLNTQVREEAVEWLIAFCEGEVDTAAREAFTAWLCTSPEHVRAYLRVSAL